MNGQSLISETFARIENFQIFLLVMPKYWGKQNFSHGSFPEVGEKQKKKKKKKVGENNGQLRFVRHHVWRTQARLDQKEKVGENNGQLRFVRHHVWHSQARLDQKL